MSKKLNFYRNELRNEIMKIDNLEQVKSIILGCLSQLERELIRERVIELDTPLISTQ